jgi:hypothetical protein
MKMGTVVVMGFRAGCLPAAAGEPKHKVQVTKTERVNFPAGGRPRQTNSIGVLTVEAWDRPDVAFDLDDRIKAPATLRMGEVMLHLREEGRYDIHAKSKFGGVNSDFPGEKERRWRPIGHRIVNRDLPAPHELNLSVKFGDIVILKTRVLKPFAPLIPASKRMAYEQRVS